MGSWQPLPSILNGFVVSPHHPNATPVSPTASKIPSPPLRPTHNTNRFSWSGVASIKDKAEPVGKNNVYEIPLDIGDEFFAFEEYRCMPEEDGRGDLWFRG